MSEKIKNVKALQVIEVTVERDGEFIIDGYTATKRTFKQYYSLDGDFITEIDAISKKFKEVINKKW